jgi:glycerophosphoryl diester phosphodiesterase
MPENSLAGFIQALDWGVTTLEMDVVVSKDRQVLVSHEPYMSHNICLDSLGNELDSASYFQYNIYQMTYREIIGYDCGSVVPPGFPNQRPVPGAKPLLSEVIKTVEARATELGIPGIRYNIETKSVAGYDEVFHPSPAAFVKLVLEVVEEYRIAERTTIQSFDNRTLIEARKLKPDISIALLIDNDAPPLAHLTELGFEPDIYSPHHRLVSDSLIRELHSKGIAVIPWTVNDPENMKKYVKMGVDGIITDYPEVLLEMLGRLNSPNQSVF